MTWTPENQEALRQEPLTDLIAKLSKDVTLLARQEVALAKQEAADQLAVVKAEAIGLSVGGLLAHCGVLVLVAALVLGLAEFIAPWLAGLVTGGLLLASGGALLLRAKTRLSQLDFGPKLVLENVERDVAAVKEAAQ